MNQPITGSGPHAVALCAALGLDPARCVSIELRMAAGEIAVVTAELLVRDHEAEQFYTVLERYNLVPEDDVRDATAMADSAVRQVAA